MTKHSAEIKKMKALLPLLFVCVFFGGCAVNRYSKLTLIERKSMDSTDLAPLFKKSETAPLYKTEVKLYGKKFGGLLLIKGMIDSSYRVVFTTETGIKLFDFEIKAEKFTVHYCIEKFNRDAVLTTIANDIKLMLLENRMNQTASLYKSDKDQELVYQFSNTKTEDYYLKNKSNNRVLKVEQMAGKKSKVVIDLQYATTTAPSVIKIVHKNIRLKIDLNLLER